VKRLLNKRKSRTKLFVLVGLFVLLFISIGYSYLKETLTINSSAEISSMRWDVHFENIVPKSGSVSPISRPVIGDDGLSITTSLNFTQPGQFYEYEVNVVNDGSIDAMIESIEGTTLNSEQQKFLIYTVTNSDGTTLVNKQLLKANTTQKLKVRIEVKEDLQKTDLPTSGDQIRIKFKLNYIQADDTAVDKNASAITYVTRQNEGQITPGDVVRIGDTEDFYVISSNQEKTVLLAKYSLLVGNVVEFDGQNLSVTGTISPQEEGYGLQSAEAGLTLEKYNEITSAGGGTWKGTVTFSSTNYWNGENGLLSPYNANGASYNGNPYPYVYDTNSNIYQYISGNGGYVDKLKEMGAPSTITGRLLTFEEATSPSIGCDANRNSCPEGSFITDTTFWLGSADTRDGVWDVLSVSSSFNSGGYSNDGNFGVRPVIEIPTSEIG